jgi:iron complex outermembrane receptor protein
LNCVKYSFFLFQLSLLPLLITINPVVAETKSDVQSQHGSHHTNLTAAKAVQDIRTRHQVSTSAQDLLAQQIPVTRVTGVKVKQTNKGLEVILTTAAGGQRLVPLILPEGKNLVIDILDATLGFSIRNGLTKTNPAPGIKEVRVSEIDESSIRLTITGSSKAPSAEIIPSQQNLVLSINSQASTAQQPDEEIEVIATGEGEQDNYNVPDATTATKTDTPLRDTPFSVQVVPEQVLEDRKVRRLTDAFQGVSGVTTNQPATSLFEGFIIRGFDTGNFILRNGLSDTSTGTAGSGLANVDRVEFLKGPAGALFGQGSLGGTVNIVTKKPLSKPAYDLEASIGNFDSYEGKLDFTGPLNTDKNLLYRFTASATTYKGFNEFNANDRYFISPVLTWLISKNTKLTLEAEYLDTKNPVGNALPANGTVSPNPNGELPYDLYVGEPSVDERNISVFRIGYDVEHKFNDNWQIRNAFRASFEQNQSSSIFPGELLEDNRTLTRDLQVNDDPSNRYQLDTYMVGDFKTGSIDHKLLFGFNLSREDFTNNGTQILEIDPIDLFDPVYGSQTVGSVIDEFFKDTSQQNDGLGIYLQDQIALTENVKFLLGGRFDIISQKLEDKNTEDEDGDTSSFQQNEGFSPRLGLVYQPSQTISLYGSYSRSLQQVTGTNFEGELFKPERGTQYEVGVKTDWLDSKLSTTLAFYQLTRSNVSTDDLDNPGFQIQTGEQESQGIELDIAGEILPGWNILAGYAYTDAEITEDNLIEVGNRINSIPENSFSLWTSYEIPQGSFKGLGLGLGLTYVGEREGNLDNTFTVPDYLRTDAALYYRRQKFRAALNINNLFDREYFRYSSDLVEPGSPLEIQSTLGFEF